MKVHQCRENGAHAYSAATPVLYSVLIFPPLLYRYGDAEQKLIQAVASYLGEQMEL